MPQFDYLTFLPQTTLTFVTFTICYLFSLIITLPLLSSILKSRKKKEKK
uniref:ATP synthase F0 subunit 8 n=1 Tax=Ishige okamurae TaxID=233772 RepID=A0A4Y5T957_9PHAE|nr:ATP synthase F0 subunit 8 [Ishige okamurae]